eukprot:scaffold235326_cov17-Prasinocladus_malaysianus.AAC.1
METSLSAILYRRKLEHSKGFSQAGAQSKGPNPAQAIQGSTAAAGCGRRGPPPLALSGPASAREAASGPPAQPLPRGPMCDSLTPDP